MLDKEKITKYLKPVLPWVIPQRIQRISINVLIKIRGELFLLLDKEVISSIRTNKKFHNLHKGDRCFILCTGPSINKQNLKPLKDEYCIAVSHFYLHKDYRYIKPHYHVMAPYHHPFGLEELKKEFGEYKRHECERTIIFLGHKRYEYSYMNFFKMHPEYTPNRFEYIYYGASVPIDEYNYKKKSVWDISRRPFGGIRTVLYCAIEVAAYMGFSHIYLLGADHDYLQDIKRGRSRNFYPDEQAIDDSALWISTEEFFLAYHIRWKQYRLMREYLEARGSHIFNATEGGLLDVFPEVTLADALSRK